MSVPEDTEPAADSKWVKKCACFVTVLGSVLLLLVVAGVLLWYFLSSRWCASGITCGDGGQCISASMWCDGVMHCAAGEDEAQCFRLYGSRSQLQAYSRQRGGWKPVCAEGWNNNFGMLACEQLGYDRETYVASGEMTSFSDDYMQLDFGSDPNTPLQQNLISSESCYANRVVMLRCIECGVRDIPPRSRIVGGEIASEGAWPWQVSLWVGGEHQCGGSIITPDWIVTAAHCLLLYNLPGDWTVYAGYLDQYEMLKNKGSSVSRLLSYTYDSSTNNNDVALMKLSQPLNMSDTVKPVCLPNVGQDLCRPQGMLDFRLGCHS
ncbi:hypothetical protein AAFF_G00397050 [Aldrovandia affinis]|uniref:Uncharacterized protein n=1 Tax=Aldrovandia affinis TaxID=143900 RepID=A0AAD7SCZ8_9TELE|nr:hypothetical protein AAFF_G00397050 [Aldrovandia affinis]